MRLDARLVSTKNDEARMSNDEEIRRDKAVRELLFVIWALSLISPAGIADRRQALAELSLLTFGIALLIRFACLLFRARCGRRAAGEHNNGQGRQNHGDCQVSHDRSRIIKLISPATVQRASIETNLAAQRRPERRNASIGYPDFVTCSSLCLSAASRR